MPIQDRILDTLPSSYLIDPNADTLGNENLLQQQLRLHGKRERLLDAAKQAQKQAGIGARGQMIGDRYVAPPKIAHFLPLVQQLAVDAQEQALSKQEQALGSRITQAQQEHLQAYPGPDADTQSTLKWSMKGAQIPGMQPVMEKFLQDRLVAAPEREALRKAKADQVAATLAEKKEQQERELAYRRERDADTATLKRELAEGNNSLRRDLAAAVASRGGGGGGDKASNYQIVQDNQGNAVRVNKLTGAVEPLGPIGRQDAAITKKEQEAASQQGSSQDALGDIANAKKLLPNSTGSGIGAGIDMLYRGVGATNEGMKANRQLKVISGRLTATVPRFEGPQSDKDIMAYKEQAADVGNESLTTSERLEALKQVELMHRRVLQNAPRTQAAAKGGSGPSIREAVEAATQKHTGSKNIDDLLNKYK